MVSASVSLCSSPSLISVATTTAKSAKSMAKTIKKAIKKGAAAIACPFKKPRQSKDMQVDSSMQLLLEHAIYGTQVHLIIHLFLVLMITSAAMTTMYPPHLYLYRLQIYASDFLLLIECRAEASIFLVCTNSCRTYYYL